MRSKLLSILGALTLVSACTRVPEAPADATAARAKLAAIPLDQPVHLAENEWQAILSPAQFYVMRRSGTERPSSSGNALEHPTGSYVCSACANPVFLAAEKFNSGTGWPSFSQPIRPEAVHAGGGISAIFGTEISCARCRSHL